VFIIRLGGLSAQTSRTRRIAGAQRPTRSLCTCARSRPREGLDSLQVRSALTRSVRRMVGGAEADEEGRFGGVLCGPVCVRVCACGGLRIAPGACTDFGSPCLASVGVFCVCGLSYRTIHVIGRHLFFAFLFCVVLCVSL